MRVESGKPGRAGDLAEMMITPRSDRLGSSSPNPITTPVQVTVQPSAY